METRFEEEAGKLVANTLNGVSIASFVGGTIGQMLRPDLVQGDGRFFLFAFLGIVFHLSAQVVLWLVYNQRSS